MTTYLGKSCSFGLPLVPFVNCCQFIYLVISLLVLRAGCGIWLYQFLIIAYLLTLKMHLNMHKHIYPVLHTYAANNELCKAFGNNLLCFCSKQNHVEFIPLLWQSRNCTSVPKVSQLLKCALTLMHFENLEIIIALIQTLQLLHLRAD